ALLEPLDHQGLLAGGGDVAESADEIIDIDNLAAELADVSSEDDITVLRHVRASTEKRVVQGVADRKPCEDFDAFKPLFEQVRNDLSSGLRVTRPFGQYATI
ncbi:GIY-YIG nuclease family protein, partial [Escherichia coli]|nr:GIY-YIG nuclease family protein [Escherichia coli]